MLLLFFASQIILYKIIIVVLNLYKRYESILLSFVELLQIAKFVLLTKVFIIIEGVP